jgi:succinoglycan biosynthesis protein ExoA
MCKTHSVVVPCPTVSIIIPCRNEVRFIASCLDSVLRNGFPLERLEILVLDGMSDDGTREIVRDYAARHSLIRMLDNLHKVTPYALNLGIREAKGDVVMRLDAHTICDRDYIAQCIRTLLEYGADDAGGTLRIIARDDTLLGRTIVKVLTQPVVVGNLRYRFSQPHEPELVDTVAFFCCRRELFQKIGLFNEKLTRIQDMEFKRRLARAGCKIMLAPGALAYYQARSDFRSFCRHNWSDGLWTVLAFAYAELMPVRWRHLAPACFVGGLFATGLLALLFPVCKWAFVAIAGGYILAILTLSGRIAVAEADPRYLFPVPLVIASMHLIRGLGSLWGLVRLFAERRFVHGIGLVLQAEKGWERTSVDKHRPCAWVKVDVSDGIKKSNR